MRPSSDWKFLARATTNREEGNRSSVPKLPRANRGSSSSRYRRYLGTRLMIDRARLGGGRGSLIATSRADESLSSTPVETFAGFPRSAIKKPPGETYRRRSGPYYRPSVRQSVWQLNGGSTGPSASSTLHSCGPANSNRELTPREMSARPRDIVGTESQRAPISRP